MLQNCFRPNSCNRQLPTFCTGGYLRIKKEHVLKSFRSSLTFQQKCFDLFSLLMTRRLLMLSKPFFFFLVTEYYFFHCGFFCPKICRDHFCMPTKNLLLLLEIYDDCGNDHRFCFYRSHITSTYLINSIFTSNRKKDELSNTIWDSLSSAG